MGGQKPKIKDVGEFGLIDLITRDTNDPSIIKGIGDDCAVIETNGLQVLTTDCMVEGDHFNRAWFSPEQIGMKAIEVNVSDIAAMGGRPRFVLVSLSLPTSLEVDFVERLYNGMWQSCREYGINIIGGNMSRSEQIVVNITLIGEVERPNLSLRGDAQPGDSIFVTGHLGNGRAGLRLFQTGMKGFEKIRRLYTEPKSQLEKAMLLGPYVHAMEDISDGLASEIKHICDASGYGARIQKEEIPIHEEVRQIAAELGEDEHEYALGGGEDFQLVFTVPERNLGDVDGFILGEITEDPEIKICHDNEEVSIGASGYDQFANHI